MFHNKEGVPSAVTGVDVHPVLLVFVLVLQNWKHVGVYH